MNFIKRALLGITRRIGKTFILLAVIFILGNVMSGAIAIQQATDNVEANIKERLGAAATVTLDNKALEELDEQQAMDLHIETLDVDLMNEIGALSYVKYYDYNMIDYMGSNNIKPYGDNEMEEDVFIGGPSFDFELKGINYAPIIDFEEEEARLVDGRVFTQEEVDSGKSVALISKKLAEENNLHVGDTFTLANEVYDYDESTAEQSLHDSRDLVLEIIGLFEPQVVEEPQDDFGGGMMDFLAFDYQNTIYVPNKIVADEAEYQMEMYMEIDEAFAELVQLEGDSFEYYTPLYILNNPEDSDAFAEEVIPLLPEYYTVVSASDQYDDIAGPVESMSKLAKYVIYIAIAATILITGLVVLLFLRDRKHELGIYLSLGERRTRVIGQILIEVLIIAMIGITISLFSGNLLANQVSSTLVKADDTSEMDFGQVIIGDGFQTDLTEEDVIDSYEVSFNTTYVLTFYIVGLLTILLSTIIPLIYIVRLNPKQILM